MSVESYVTNSSDSVVREYMQFPLQNLKSVLHQIKTVVKYTSLADKELAVMTPEGKIIKVSRDRLMVIMEDNLEEVAKVLC